MDPSTKQNNNKQRKQRRKQIRNEVKQIVSTQEGSLPSGRLIREVMTKKEARRYINTLVDPESYPGVRYPDTFCRKTGTFQGKIYNDQYYFKLGNAAGEKEGLFLSYLSPTLVSPLRQYELTPASTVTRGMFLVQTDQTDHYGLFSTVEDTPTIASSSDQMYIGRGAVMNLKSMVSWSDQDFASPPIRSIRADGTVMYGFPGGFDPAGSVVVDITSTTASVGDTWGVEFLSNTNSTAVIAVPELAANTRNYRVVIPIGVLIAAGVLSATGYAPLPGVAVRIHNTIPTSELIQAVCIGFNGTLGPLNRFQEYSLPDEQECVEKIDSYRVVSMSDWLEYEGSDFQNGGQVAAIMYRGGQSPAENGLWDYETIADTPTSYQGPMKHGTYSFWLPSNYSDMAMRPIDSADRWSLPYVVNAGLVSTPDQVRALRHKIVINYEFISTSQLFTYEGTNPDLDVLELTSVVLRDVPTAMSNGIHWDVIKQAIKKVGNAVRDVSGWVVENKHWIVPAIGAAASLL